MLSRYLRAGLLAVAAAIVSGLTCACSEQTHTRGNETPPQVVESSGGAGALAATSNGKTSTGSEVKPMHTEKATFGAGCFWGVEARFRQVEGVVSTAVGYSGGHFPNPTYDDVCSDRTGHAEVVQIEYDPAVVSFEQLLDVFWNNHNPTTPNRQGPDVGAQYRSVIFYHTPAQADAARASKERLEKSGRFKSKIVTEIVPATLFYKAEEYHQQYLAKHGQKSCATSVRD